MLLPSISFQGNCEEAINYYKDLFGAEVKVINYADESATNTRFVAYSEVVLFGATLMLADGADHKMEHQNFHFTINFDAEEEMRAVFEKLANDGQVIEEPTSQFWAKLNAYVIDRFGIFWNIMFEIKKF